MRFGSCSTPKAAVHTAIPGELALGIWLVFSPGLFGLEGAASNLNHLGGALILVVSVIALGEPVRAVRYLNPLLGLSLAGLLWYVEGGATAAAVNGVVVGAVVAILSIPRGPKRETYGSWDRLVV